MRKFICLFLLFFAISFICFPSFGQQVGQKNLKKWCSVGDIVSSPSVREIGNNFPNTNSILIDQNGVIIIPVVFHVLYNTSQSFLEDIDITLINSQIERLNIDFSKNNPDVNQVPIPWAGLPADVKIQFKLACIDPQGNATNGIRRIETTNYSFSQTHLYDAKRTIYGGDDAWPTDTYLNIWTCNMEANLGDAMFPWERNGTTNDGTPLGISNDLLDGIVLHYEVVGDNNSHATLNKGRVAVHEVGHWLGLHHIFFNRCNAPGDEVSDTPFQYEGNFNICPTFPSFSCTSEPYGDMFMNYMDQTTDACKYMYTFGQKDRMRSYFSQNGPPGTRFPFIQNYFGIRHFAVNPHNVQNNTITVFMYNPACLPVTYTYTGSVTEISHNNQQIVFSVACGTSGTVSLTATSGNYTDDYTFDFENSAFCIWPKVYAGGYNQVIKLDNSNNIFTNFGTPNMTNNINHNGGVVPTTPGNYTVQYNKTTGVTTWINGPNFGPLFVLNSGDVQMYANGSSGNTVFYSGSTGLAVSGPASVPIDEVILAEDINNTFITKSSNSLNVHSSLGSSSIPFLSGNTDILRTIYNPLTKKLFVLYSSTTLAIYILNNNTLSLANNFILNSFYLAQVNNSDEIFALYTDNVGSFRIESVDYNGIHTPLLINGFSNINLEPVLRSCNSYTDDKILVMQISDANFYYINTATLITKKIPYTSFGNSGIPGNYFFEGDNLYLAGAYDGTGMTIGNQVMPLLVLDGSSGFVTKFNVQTDFSFRLPAENFVSNPVFSKTISPAALQNKTNETIILSDAKVTLSPNPAKNSLLVNIEQNESKTASLSIVTITNTIGVVMLRQKTNQIMLTVDISRFRGGIYYVTVLTDKGFKTTQMFMKE